MALWFFGFQKFICFVDSDHNTSFITTLLYTFASIVVIGLPSQPTKAYVGVEPQKFRSFESSKMLLDCCSTKMSTITWTQGIILFCKSSVSYKFNKNQKPTTLKECTNKD